jgi:hypothetical protein
MISENEIRTVSGTTEGLPGAEQASDLGCCAPPGTRTPNPLIVGPICSMLLVDARKPYISWAFATLWSLVAVTRLLTLPVESRPVSRTESPSCAVAGSSRVDGYVSSWTQLHIRTQGYELVCHQFIGVRGRSAKRGRPMLRPSTDASVLL